MAGWPPGGYRLKFSTMKSFRVLTWFGLVPTLAFLSAGCATQVTSVHTWRNPDFSPTAADTIALTEHPNPSAQDQALQQLLTTTLQQDGFKMTSPAQADYLLAFVLDEATQQQQQIVYRHDDQPVGAPFTPQRDSQVGMMSSYSAQVPDHVVTFRCTTKFIRLYLYTNPKTHAGNFQLAWQGNIDVNQSVPTGSEPVLLKTLLRYFGKNQNGPVKPLP